MCIAHTDILVKILSSFFPARTTMHGQEAVVLYRLRINAIFATEWNAQNLHQNIPVCVDFSTNIYSSVRCKRKCIFSDIFFAFELFNAQCRSSHMQSLQHCRWTSRETIIYSSPSHRWILWFYFFIPDVYCFFLFSAFQSQMPVVHTNTRKKYT